MYTLSLVSLYCRVYKNIDQMEVSSGASPRMSLDQLQKEGSEETHFQNFVVYVNQFFKLDLRPELEQIT